MGIDFGINYMEKTVINVMLLSRIRKHGSVTS